MWACAGLQFSWHLALQDKANTKSDQLLFKMQGLLLLLGSVLLLGSTEGNEKYDELHERFKEIVDKAIEKANVDPQYPKHIDFHSILRSDDDKILVHVLLKPTSCDKKERVHRRECQISKGTPWMSCVACHGNIDCVPLRQRKKVECSRHFTGAAHAMSHQSEGNHEQQTGCLGCI